MSKLMMLVAAKWREFSNINPHLQSEQSESNETEYNLKPSRTRPLKESKDTDAIDDEDDDDDDEETKIKKKRGTRVKKSLKKASKVPTLKIKIGKRKRGSSVNIS